MFALQKANQLSYEQMILGNNLLLIHKGLFWLENYFNLHAFLHDFRKKTRFVSFSRQCLNMDFAYLNWAQSKLYLTLKSSFVDTRWSTRDHMVKWSSSKSCSLSILNCRDQSPSWTNQGSPMGWCDWKNFRWRRWKKNSYLKRLEFGVDCVVYAEWDETAWFNSSGVELTG